MLVGILANESPDSVNKWILACKKYEVSYKVINLMANDWLEQVRSENFDFFLSRPSGELEYYKTAFDERLYIINVIMKKRVYPSYNETFYYENKRFLSYFLNAENIPHPQTDVFYDKEEALAFINNCSYPIVGKTNIGASGSGVDIIKTSGNARKYIRHAFNGNGIKRRFGPNRVTGSPKKWLEKALKSPKYLMNKLKQYFSIFENSQKNYVIFQKFVPHDFEWRVAKIGESYFAHKKIKVGDKASGSKGIDYVNPPLSILDFVKGICDKQSINFMAIDIFENPKGGYLVNEMQTLFGHVQSYILKVDGKVGRYIYDNGWKFEEGDFNTNESYDLRLAYILSIEKNVKK